MSRRRRASAALAVIVLVALISACGSSAPAGTRSVGASSNTAAAAKGAKGVKFAECMRSNGVGDFPDPTANGEFVYGVSVTPAVFDKAVAACKTLQPPGSLSAQRSPKQQSLALKFAQCVRNNGVKDFPDPVNGQPLIDTTKIPSSNPPGGMSILNAATHECGGLLQLAARGGTGG
ncbi:MAG: hypothetical protein QOH12_2429 [Solirubrobacteraceae bacterium]|jgi:hypothetical protein|nr:hypothetical protein [Solirubrobacteraceae bacterium]